MVRGRVVDPAGSPVAGMYVYGGTIAAGAFVPGSVAAGVTDAQGRYAVPCTGGPVLLTSWRLNTPLGATATGRWAPTYLAAPLCSRVTAYPRTTVFAGATIQGHVTTDAVCPTQEFSLQLWIGGDPASTVLLTDVEAGDTYRIPGLPPGSHVLHAQGQQTTIEVPATTVHDVTFACSAVSPPTDDPTASPSPHPTPSETGAPPPPTDTSSPMPTATSTSTSTGH
jgi:hypothetical protein